MLNVPACLDVDTCEYNAYFTQSIHVHRSLILDMTCLEAHKTLVLNLLANEGRVSESAPKIGELIHLVDRFEPKNHSLYYNIALPFARLVSVVLYYMCICWWVWFCTMCVYAGGCGSVLHMCVYMVGVVLYYVCICW